MLPKHEANDRLYTLAFSGTVIRHGTTAKLQSSVRNKVANGTDKRKLCILPVACHTDLVL